MQQGAQDRNMFSPRNAGRRSLPDCSHYCLPLSAAAVYLPMIVSLLGRVLVWLWVLMQRLGSENMKSLLTD